MLLETIRIYKCTYVYISTVRKRKQIYTCRDLIYPCLRTNTCITKHVILSITTNKTKTKYCIHIHTNNVYT